MRKTVDLNALRTFAQVVAAGGFRRAAVKLDMPLSTVSNHVSKLEEEVGVALLDRTTRVLRLTEAGQRFCASVAPALEVLEAATPMAQATSATPSGRLRATLPTDLGLDLLPEVALAYRARFPSVELECELSDQRRNLLEDGFDLAIRAGHLEDSSLACKAIGDEVRLVTCAAPAYIDRHGLPATPDELADHACLVMSGAQRPGRWTFSVEGREALVRVPAALAVNSFSVLRDLARQGIGLVQLPSFMLRSDAADGSLVEVLRPYAPPHVRFHALYPRSARLSQKTQGFVEMLDKALRG